MYIQITDKCNMTCEHCGFACTKKGSFMSLDTFKATCCFHSEEYTAELAERNA